MNESLQYAQPYLELGCMNCDDPVAAGSQAVPRSNTQNFLPALPSPISWKNYGSKLKKKKICKCKFDDLSLIANFHKAELFAHNL